MPAKRAAALEGSEVRRGVWPSQRQGHLPGHVFAGQRRQRLARLEKRGREEQAVVLWA